MLGLQAQYGNGWFDLKMIVQDIILVDSSAVYLPLYRTYYFGLVRVIRREHNQK